jgi:hypothetical protein
VNATAVALRDDVLHLRILRSFAMWRFAAALPLINLARFDFREDDRGADFFERRRVFLRRLDEERVARFVRRLRPPAGEGIDP